MNTRLNSVILLFCNYIKSKRNYIFYFNNNVYLFPIEFILKICHSIIILRFKSPHLFSINYIIVLRTSWGLLSKVYLTYWYCFSIIVMLIMTLISLMNKDFLFAYMLRSEYTRIIHILSGCYKICPLVVLIHTCIH